MKAKFLQLLGAALLIGPIVAHSAFAFAVDGGSSGSLAGQTVATEADGMALFAIAVGLLLSLKRRRRALVLNNQRAARR